MKHLLMLTSVAVMIGMAAPAYADPPSGADADFIDQLKAAGLTEQDPAKAIAAAKDMCSLENSGTPATVIETNLVSQNPGLTKHDAAQFMTLAEGKYCSKNLSNPSESPKPEASPSGSPKPENSPSESPKPPGT